MGSKLSTSSVPSNDSTAGAFETLTANRSPSHRHHPHHSAANHQSSNATQALDAALAAHPAAATILMRAYNGGGSDSGGPSGGGGAGSGSGSSGFSIISSADGTQNQRLSPASLYYNVFANRAYETASTLNNSTNQNSASQPTIFHSSRGSPQVRHAVRCPFCLQVLLSDDVEQHLAVCLTRAQPVNFISYNDDVLTCNKGECVICLEDLEEGQSIARLPCLCIYHKKCIDQWFEINRSCPEHPSMD